MQGKYYCQYSNNKYRNRSIDIRELENTKKTE